MRRRRITKVVAWMAAVVVATAVLYYLVRASTFGPNGGSGISDLPAGLWLTFLSVAGGAGLVAHRFATAVLSPRPRRE